MKNVQFEQTRKAPQSKQRDLKRKGMGNKPNASAASSEEDIQVLFEKDFLGSYTAEALLTWQDGKRVHCKYLPLSHTKP